MTFLPTTNGARFVLETTYGSRVMTNHFWASREGQWGADDLVGMANSLMDNLDGSQFQGRMSDSVTLRVRAVDERSYDGPVVYDTYGSAVNGGAAYEILPLNVAMCLTLYTGLRGRAYRGRLYFSGFTESNWSGGSFDVTAEAAVEGLAASFKGLFEGGGWTWGVRSTQVDGVARSAAVITPIVAYQVRSPLATSQRRRVGRA